MQDMIEAIHAAVTQGATAEQKQRGAQACRTLLAALEAEVGKPIPFPGAPAPGPLAGISSDQALDLLIARLRTVAEAKDKASAAATVAQPSAEPPGLRIAFVQPPRSAPRDPSASRLPAKRKP